MSLKEREVDMKEMAKKRRGAKLISRICITLVAFALAVTTFAAAFAPPAEALAKKKCSHKYKTYYRTNYGSSYETKKHWVIVKCKKCGKQKSSKLKSHNFKGRKCKTCGYRK